MNHLTNLYKIPTPRLWDNWGGIVGPKTWRNVIVRFKTFFYVEIAWGSHICLWIGIRGIVSNRQTGINKKAPGGEKTSGPYPLLYLGGLQINTYFIPLEIIWDVAELVVRKRFGISGPGGTDPESLQECLLKFGEYSKKLRISVGIFVDWLSNQTPPRAAYHEFMFSPLILLDNQNEVRPVGVRETWIRLFAKCVLKVTGPEAINACQYDQGYDGPKAEIYR